MTFPSSDALCLACYRNQGQFTEKIIGSSGSHFCATPAGNPQARKQLSECSLLLGFELLTAQTVRCPAEVNPPGLSCPTAKGL